LTSLESVRVVESSGWSERQSQMTNGLIKRRYNFESFAIGKNILDKLYPPLVLSAWITFCEVTRPPALFESTPDKYTMFVSRIHPRAEACRQILKTKWCICPWSIQNRAGTLSIHVLSLFHLYPLPVT
jgi:hypothetical protein